MSDFQTQVNTTQPNGIAGEIAYGVDHEAVTLVVVTPTDKNIIGRAYFRWYDDITCGVGGQTLKFAGIAVLSKSAVGVGVVESGDSFVVRQHTTVTLLTKGVVYVKIEGTRTPTIGSPLQYHQDTGAISVAPSFTTADGSNRIMRNAKVDYRNGLVGDVLPIKIVGV